MSAERPENFANADPQAKKEWMEGVKAFRYFTDEVLDLEFELARIFELDEAPGWGIDDYDGPIMSLPDGTGYMIDVRIMRCDKDWNEIDANGKDRTAPRPKDVPTPRTPGGTVHRSFTRRVQAYLSRLRS